MLTPRGFHNRNADNNSTGQPFTARVAVQSDGRGARGAANKSFRQFSTHGRYFPPPPSPPPSPPLPSILIARG